MICPYCEVEITTSQVDAEDGYCPECGSAITPSTIFMDQDDDVLDDLDDLDELDELDPFEKRDRSNVLEDDEY